MRLPPMFYRLVTGLYHDPHYDWKGKARLKTKGDVQYHIEALVFLK
jgi:hypothetical protein